MEMWEREKEIGEEEEKEIESRNANIENWLMINVIEKCRNNQRVEIGKWNHNVGVGNVESVEHTR